MPMLRSLAVVLLTLFAVLSNGNTRAETVLLQGIVVDADGKPVAGADVLLEKDMIDPDQWQRSDENGRFALPVPSNEIGAWMSVYAVSPNKEQLGEGRPKFKEGNREIPEITVTLKPARLISGTVTDEAGNPVEGAWVGGTWDTPYPNVTKSDKDGNFRFAYPDDDIRTLQQVFAVHRKLGMDYLDTEEGRGHRGKTPPEKIKNGPFMLKLLPWKTYKLQVVDEHQTPLPGVEVYSWLPRIPQSKSSLNCSRLMNRLFQQRTDAQGIAEVPSVVERTYFVARCPDEGVLMPDGKRRVFASADQHWDDFDKSAPIMTLVMKSRGNVKGTVKRADGTPVPWSPVSIKRHSACGHGLQWTNVNGEFGIPWCKAGEVWDIGVDSKLGAAPGVFEFNVGNGVEEKRLDFVLEKGIRLHGTVYNPDGTPSEKYQIFLHEKCPESLLAKEPDFGKTCPPGGCPVGVVVRQTSDYFEPNSKGKYEYFLPAVERKYDISVSSFTHPDVSCELKDYQVKGNENSIELDFRLKPIEKK